MKTYHLFPDGIHWTLAREHDDRRFLFENEEDALAGCSEFMRERPGTLRMHLCRDTFEREFRGAIPQAA